MTPAEIAPLEARQFGLLIRKFGADPEAFHLRKFSLPGRQAFRIRVVGRGAATVYDSASSADWMGPFAADLARGLFGTSGVAPMSAVLDKLLHEAERELAVHGLLGVLTFLNKRVPHRFTALYRLDPGRLLRNVAVVDKHLQLDPLDLKVVPLGDSFCQFVLRDGLFLTEQSGSDPRLVGHPYRGIVGCYVGVPVRTGPGDPAGTLCHFDTETHTLPDDEYFLLERVASLLPAFLAS
jgi:hypothetical protein